MRLVEDASYSPMNSHSSMPSDTYLSTVRSDGLDRRGRGRWWRRLRGGGVGGGLGFGSGFGFGGGDGGGFRRRLRRQPRLRRHSGYRPRPTRGPSPGVHWALYPGPSAQAGLTATRLLLPLRSAVATTTIVRVAIMRAYRHGIAWLVFLVRALAVLGRVGLGRKAKHRGREAGVLGSNSATCRKRGERGACKRCEAEAARLWLDWLRLN